MPAFARSRRGALPPTLPQDALLKPCPSDALTRLAEVSGFIQRHRKVDPTDWSWSGDTSELIQQNDSIQVIATDPVVDNPSFVIWLGGSGDFYGDFQILF